LGKTTNHFTELFFSLACSSLSSCSHFRSIEPALAAKFTFRFCDEDNDDVNDDDLAVRANAYRVRRGRMMKWFSLDVLFLCVVTDSLSLSPHSFLNSRAMRKRKMRGILLREEEEEEEEE